MPRRCPEHGGRYLRMSSRRGGGGLFVARCARSRTKGWASAELVLNHSF
jgi:hypothetical protein